MENTHAVETIEKAEAHTEKTKPKDPEKQVEEIKKKVESPVVKKAKVPEVTKANVSITIMPREERKKLKEQEVAFQKAQMEKTKQRAKEQAERAKRLKDQLFAQAEKERIRKEEESKQKEEEAKKKQEEYQAKMKAKIEQREKERAERKEQYKQSNAASKSVQAQKPMYKELQLKDQQEKDKDFQVAKQLTKLRKEKNLVDWTSIENKKPHQRTKSENPNPNVPKSEPSFSNRHKSIMQRVKYENQLRKMEEDRVLEEKKRLITRKAQYSEVIKDIRKPNIDLGKRAELAQQIDRLKTKPRIAQKVTVTSEDLQFPPKNFNPKPFKQNPLIPIVTKRNLKLPKQIDYLHETRRSLSPQRKSEDKWRQKIAKMSQSQNIDEVTRGAKKLEKLAEQKEVALNNLYTVQDIEQADEVNELYLESVRAKLNALNA